MKQLTQLCVRRKHSRRRPVAGEWNLAVPFILHEYGEVGAKPLAYPARCARGRVHQPWVTFLVRIQAGLRAEVGAYPTLLASSLEERRHTLVVLACGALPSFS